MNKINKKILFTFLFLIILFFVVHKPSKLNKGFPIPLTAFQSNIDYKNQYEVYNWKMASEEHGLPYYYELILKMWGWNEVKEEALGARKVFTKDGEIVNIISLNDKMELHFINN
ncbi:hypothetical protein ACFVRR_14685 [Gottfriedia sp. NPDC057948]|uniref:hypothetical protein n=1 Tax=Gottfriedia sp. NPDC057948 TaxID=3346287 RepID=UPI0036DC3D79